MIYRKFLILSTLIFLFFYKPCFGQSDTLFLSLDDALDLAQKKSPSAEEAKIDRESGLLSLSGSILAMLPTPSATASYAKTQTNIIPETKSYTGTVGLNQVVFSPDIFGNVYKGKLYNDYYRLQAKDKTANLIYSVKSSYFTLAKTYNLFEVTQASLKRALDNYDLAKEKNRLGQTSKFELLRSETFKTQAEIDLLTAEKNLEISIEDLKGQIGLTDRTIVKPTTTPPTPDVDINFEALFDKIHKTNPSLQSAKKFKSIAKTSFAQSIANLLPSASLFWSSTYTDTTIPKHISNWKENDAISYGVRLNIPVFEIKSYFFNIGNSRNEARRANVQFKQAEILLRKTATNAIYTYEESKKRYEFALKNLELNRDLLELAQQQYRLGTISQLDLFNAEITFNTAQNTYISALYDTYTSYAQLEYLLGIDDKIEP